jgi:hypothetical protein
MPGGAGATTTEIYVRTDSEGFDFEFDSRSRAGRLWCMDQRYGRNSPLPLRDQLMRT